MKKFLSHFGSGILGALLTLGFFAITGKLKAPDVVHVIDTEIQWIDTCFTITEIPPLIEDKVLPGKPVIQKDTPDTIYYAELDTITITCKPRIEYYEFEYKDSLLEISELIAIKGCNIEVVDFDRTVKMDTLIKYETREKLTTVTMKPEPVPVYYKKNRIKLGYQTSNEFLHGPRLGFEWKNGIQISATKFLNNPGGSIDLDFTIFSYK